MNTIALGAGALTRAEMHHCHSFSRFSTIPPRHHRHALAPRELALQPVLLVCLTRVSPCGTTHCMIARDE